MWDVVEEVRSKCISQLRQSLERDKLQLRGERVGTGKVTLSHTHHAILTGRGRGREGRGECGGRGRRTAKYQPRRTHKGQCMCVLATLFLWQLLQLAEHHLDMMECVLVRVEELLDQRS